SLRYFGTFHLNLENGHVWKSEGVFEKDHKINSPHVHFDKNIKLCVKDLLRDRVRQYNDNGH
ncbi:hypothetical protein OU679_25375, partial [Escherichia coli]|nr:hypothetical protein [Escherichia coli]